MRFSIIIPVYNSEKYLKACVNSVLQQSYKDIEVILVDDGSKDRSPQICDTYAGQDKRIRTIHKKNGGTADARNADLEVATGDYITFIDNDDYWKDRYALEKIQNQLQESWADVLMFDTINYWECSSKYIYSSHQCNRNEVLYQKKENALRHIMENGLLYRAVWAKVIRRQLIRKNNLYFVKGIRNEDTEWTAKLLLCAQSYDWFEEAFYVYRKGTGVAQTDRKVTLKEVTDLQNILKKYIHIGKNLGENNREFQELFYSYLAYPFAVLMGQIRLVEDTNKDLESFAKRNANILKYDVDPSIKKVKKVYCILGFKITSLLLKLYLLR